MDCVQNIPVEDSECLDNCEGLLVNSFNSIETEYIMFNFLFPNVFEDYEKFKGKYEGFEWESKLQMVRILFDTPTFDRITKDRAAKFIDMLSAIGGTMGLLTGFSIISGIEIVYFALKFFLSSLNKVWKVSITFLKFIV